MDFLSRYFLKFNKNNEKDVILSWIPVVLYCILIFYMSSRPVNLDAIKIKHLDKVIHLIEYSILSYLIVRAKVGTSINKDKKRLTFSYFAVFFTILYGISDEIHQYFIPFRTADYMDVVFDSFGAFLGQKIYLLCKHS